MKLIVLLITVACLQVSAKVSAQAITINQSNAALTDVFNTIKKQSGYRFFWKGDDLAQFKVSITLKNANIEETMNTLLKDLPLTYTITEHTVVINQKEKSLLDKIKEKVAAVTAPFNTISGLVTNKVNEALPGATVLNKRTKTGTTTDIHGFYTIRDVLPTDTLQISFIGYKMLNVPVGKSGFLNVKLEETDNKLDEVVVQAYGRTTQRTTTGNIGRITAADIEKQPVSNPLLALEGRIPGLLIAPQTGYEDGPLKVEIRGHSTLDSKYTTDPLYIIDGVPLTVLDVQTTNPTVKLSDQFLSVSRGLDQTGLSYAGGQSPLSNINPQDIESMEVLKDADATAIYGSRGANGVILITTKRGKMGTNQFSLNATEGIDKVTRYLPLLNTQDYIAMRYEQYRNEGRQPTAADAPDLFVWDRNRYTDWQKYIYGGMGKRTNVQATLSGGNESTTFRLSGGYSNSKDITTKTGANQRATFAMNLVNTSANKRLVTSFSANYAYSDVNQLNLTGIAALPPNAPSPYDSNGNVNYYEYNKLTGYGTNPFSSLLKPYNNIGNALTASLNINYTMAKGLAAGVSVGYTNNQNYQTLFNPIASQNPYSTIPPTGSSRFGNDHVYNLIAEPKLTYNRLISKGTLDFLLGGTIQTNTTQGIATTGTGYTSDLFIRSMSLAPVTSTVDNYGEYKYAGIFARLGYNWENKYIINFNGRRDGSSRFGPGKQFGNFGSVGLAWIPTEERVIKKALPKFIDFIKFRGSYGITGSDNINDYQYLSLYGNTGTVKLTPYSGVAPLIPTIESNPDFQWTVNKKLDVEGTVELLNGAISIDADYYRNRCDNQLVGIALPEFTGFTTVTGNSPANVQNSGWEFTFSTNVTKGKNFSWRNSFNIAFNKNVLLAYPGLESSPFRYQYKIGTTINTTYVINYAGIDPYTGLYTYTDRNGDGALNNTITAFPGTQFNDNYVLINREPDFAGGMTSTFSYKSLTLALAFSFVKQMGINAVNSGGVSTAGTGAANIPQFVYDGRWRYTGQTDALYARLSTGNLVTATVNSSNAGYSDASYIRLRTATVTYGLPLKLINKIGLRNLTFNISTNNLFVITAYKGYDPEVTTNIGQQPPVRTIVTGLTATF